MNEIDDEADPGERESIADVAGRLADDVEQMIRAEVELYRAQAGVSIARAIPAAGFFVAGIVLAQAAAGALVVGLIFMLTPYWGAGLATLAVITGAGAIVAILIRIGISRLNAIIRPGEVP